LKVSPPVVLRAVADFTDPIRPAGEGNLSLFGLMTTPCEALTGFLMLDLIANFERLFHGWRLAERHREIHVAPARLGEQALARNGDAI